MIRAVVVDDEELARRSLKTALAIEQDLEVVAEASNGLEALERISEHEPDVVFLDIEMPGLNGFEVLANLKAAPLIVFVTAYDEYAVRAFEANAIDYLLKPTQPQRVVHAVERVRAALGKGTGSNAEALRKLLAELRPAGPRKIAARKGKRIVLLPLKEVMRAAIEDKLVFLHTAGERYLTDKSVGELETQLESCGFFRISRGELVNLEYVTEIVPWFSGTYKIRLTTGAELDVSRDRGRRLKEVMNI
ncbi:MAG TPA: LytTR family DNA-binding domain-containing protein [Bryobacteraceae bacterium]